MAGSFPLREGYRVEALNRDIFAELQPLMLDAFGDSVSPGYFQWKYLDNPAGEAIGCIARSEQDGAIAAFYGMIPETYRFDGTSRRIYQSCDTMTHSQHRRRGLFQALARLTYDRALEADPRFLAFGFGGPTSTPGFVKMGWKVAFEIPYLFQPYPLTAFSSLGSRKAELAALNQPDDPLIALIGRSRLNASNSIDRSQAFVAWRLANPRRQYNYLRDGDDAYAIFYRSGDFVFLFDFWYGPAVLRSPPQTRVKRIESEKLKIVRVTEPTLQPNENVVDVEFLFFVVGKDIKFREFWETHRMRYFFLPELESFLDDAGFTPRHKLEWLTGNVPSTNSWSVYVLAQLAADEESHSD